MHPPKKKLSKESREFSLFPSSIAEVCGMCENQDILKFI